MKYGKKKKKQNKQTKKQEEMWQKYTDTLHFFLLFDRWITGQHQHFFSFLNLTWHVNLFTNFERGFNNEYMTPF